MTTVGKSSRCSAVSCCDQASQALLLYSRNTQRAWQRQQSRAGGRERADIHSRAVDRGEHSYPALVSSFRWMTLLSLCLAVSFALCLSLSLSPGSSLCPRRSRNQLMSAQTQWPQVLCVLEPAKKDKTAKKRIMERVERGRVVWRIVKN